MPLTEPVTRAEIALTIEYLRRRARHARSEADLADTRAGRAAARIAADALDEAAGRVDRQRVAYSGR